MSFNALETGFEVGSPTRPVGLANYGFSFSFFL
jgi:hypothetical protein